MRVPLSWLREYVDLPPVTAREVAAKLVRAGLEVERVEPVGHDVKNLVVGEVLAIEDVTGTKKPIRYCTVETGETQPRGIICGATNFAVGARVPVALPGVVLRRGGSSDSDFVVVLEGTVAVVEPGDDQAPRTLAVHGPGRFLGGLNILAGQRPVGSVVAREPGSVLIIPIERLRTLLTREPTLSNVIIRSSLLLRAHLIGRATAYQVIGERHWPASHQLQDLLTTHAIPHQWLDPTDDPAGQRILRELTPNDDRTPIVLAPDGRVLFDPTPEDLTGTLAT